MQTHERYSILLGRTNRAGGTSRARAQRRQILRGGNVAKSDTAGNAVLHLPPDNYVLVIEPPRGAPYLARETELSVAGDPCEQTIKLALEPGATIVLSAVEAETNKPLAGVSFFQQSDSGNDRRALHSQTVIADYPATNVKAELRAVLPPGRLREIDMIMARYQFRS